MMPESHLTVVAYEDLEIGDGITFLDNGLDYGALATCGLPVVRRANSYSDRPLHGVAMASAAAGEILEIRTAHSGSLPIKITVWAVGFAESYVPGDRVKAWGDSPEYVNGTVTPLIDDPSNPPLSCGIGVARAGITAAEDKNETRVEVLVVRSII